MFVFKLEILFSVLFCVVNINIGSVVFFFWIDFSMLRLLVLGKFKLRMIMLFWFVLSVVRVFVFE